MGPKDHCTMASAPSLISVPAIIPRSPAFVLLRPGILVDPCDQRNYLLTPWPAGTCSRSTEGTILQAAGKSYQYPPGYLYHLLSPIIWCHLRTNGTDFSLYRLCCWHTLGRTVALSQIPEASAVQRSCWIHTLQLSTWNTYTLKFVLLSCLPQLPSRSV